MRTTLLIVLALLTWPQALIADVGAHKLFVGTFRDAEDLKGKIAEGENMTTADLTVIPCDKGTQFAAAYMLEISLAAQREARQHTFTETWIFPESGETEASVVSREITGYFKRKRSNPLVSALVVAEGVSEESVYYLSVEKDNEIYLEHEFLVLGCSDATRQALMDALSADDPDELVCRTEPQTGSRLKKRVCGTRDELERYRDMLETELRGK